MLPVHTSCAVFPAHSSGLPERPRGRLCGPCGAVENSIHHEKSCFKKTNTIYEREHKSLVGGVKKAKKSKKQVQLYGILEKLPEKSTVKS